MNETFQRSERHTAPATTMTSTRAWWPCLLGLLVWTGCAIPSEASEAEAEDETTTSSTTSALVSGPSSPRLGYSCDGTFCTCTGDDDCNDMFSGDKCGGKAICHISPTDVPRCRCYQVRSQPNISLSPVSGGVYGVYAP